MLCTMITIKPLEKSCQQPLRLAVMDNGKIPQPAFIFPGTVQAGLDTDKTCYNVSDSMIRSIADCHPSTDAVPEFLKILLHLQQFLDLFFLTKNCS